jgi:hypothetical protein
LDCGDANEGIASASMTTQTSGDWTRPITWLARMVGERSTAPSIFPAPTIRFAPSIFSTPAVFPTPAILGDWDVLLPAILT